MGLDNCRKSLIQSANYWRDINLEVSSLKKSNTDLSSFVKTGQYFYQCFELRFEEDTELRSEYDDRIVTQNHFFKKDDIWLQ